jgi:long-subunit acyl-CoA synthetase (AMP-forming)
MNILINKLMESLINNKAKILYKNKVYSYIDLYNRVNEFKNLYLNKKINTIGICGENSFDWIAADLAALMADITCVPIPYFFSEDQKLHLINNAKIDHLIEDGVIKETGLISDKLNFSKITYTSGTTGTPKGVCLTFNNIYNTLFSLNSAVDVEIKSHINILPYSTLLENLAGIYLPILRGTDIFIYPLNELGFNGSSKLDISKMHQVLQQIKPESMIMVPELIRNLYLTYNENFDYLNNFKFISVGGGKVNESILKNMHNKNIKVFEGYGLSECCSVVSLNTPKNYKIGTAGKILPHVSVEIINNEIVVSGNSMAGYLGLDSNINKIHTGDLGFIDKDGFLVIYGRSKNTIVTGFGRKVSPEWIEDQFKSIPYIKNCLVYGNEDTTITMKVDLIDKSFESSFKKEAENINDKLPEYAKVINFEFEDLTKFFVNGKLKRNIQ